VSMNTSDAKEFLLGKFILFDDANQLWQQLKSANEISLARRVLERVRSGNVLQDRLPSDRKTKARLCQQHAELTSKDPELSVDMRHERALEILGEMFDLDDSALDGDSETLGIAGGICKRRWMDLGQYEDLQRAAEFYRRGMPEQMEEDGYAHINAAFMQDLLGHAFSLSTGAIEEARRIRELILTELPALADVKDEGNKWCNAATRAEALFGLKRYKEAVSAIKAVTKRPALWQMQSTVQQISALAHLQEDRPLDNSEIREVFDVLLLGAGEAARSAVLGKVGLALSGGGFRASFYHLGVLARLAELDVLRHVDVLSCVSGGSIVGACYWLMLRGQLVKKSPLSQNDYISLVQELIEHFIGAVAQNLRGKPSKLEAGWRLLTGSKGALDSEKIAEALQRYFYGPLWTEGESLFMHSLPFKPIDYNPAFTGDPEVNPTKHNWLRTDKVPVLVLNASTVNTGHAWQFTPTWMGESPWSTHPAADSVPRLQWHYYVPAKHWQITLARAVSASACVPGLFEPLRMDDAYDDIKVQLVDGGVHDNQGTVALLAQNCNVLIVSDAAGQLMLEKEPKSGPAGLVGYALRSMDTLMERVRLANYADLAARVRAKLLRGMMFLHMKDGLDADVIRLTFSEEPYEIHRAPLSPLGVRKDFQKAIAELRTDLDHFSAEESDALMACGYRMAASAFDRDLRQYQPLFGTVVEGKWRFAAMSREIESTAPTTPRRDALLAVLHKGSQRQI